MIKIEKTEVVGLGPAIRGLRNPMNSWDKSDTRFECANEGFDVECLCDCSNAFVGENDLTLMKNLVKAGTDHRKFMRMIVVYLDITAPLYWWKEFDTYKVGTVANSCSTMHKIHDKEFTLDDFSHDKLIDSCGYRDSVDVHTDLDFVERFDSTYMLNMVIEMLNGYRKLYLETNEKKYWWQMIQLLPSSYNQKRTVMLNYEVLANIYKSRKNHRLDEWILLIEWIKTLPYSKLITGDFE